MEELRKVLKEILRMEPISNRGKAIQYSNLQVILSDSFDEGYKQGLEMGRHLTVIKSSEEK